MPPSLTEFYLSDNGTVANYLAMIGSDGNTYLIDLSDPTKLGIVDSNGNSLYIDSAGLHFPLQIVVLLSIWTLPTSLNNYHLRQLLSHSRAATLSLKDSKRLLSLSSSN
jgi:hypothetical protein